MTGSSLVITARLGSATDCESFSDVKRGLGKWPGPSAAQYPVALRTLPVTACHLLLEAHLGLDYVK